MITTGAKLFFGFAAVAFLGALVYGGATAGHEIDLDTFLGVLTLGYKGRVGDHAGYAVLMAIAGASLFLGALIVSFRDADPSAQAQLVGSDALPVAPVARTEAVAPAIAALGAALVAVGVVVAAPLTIAGLGLMAAATFEWAARTWSERATGDPAVNRVIRSRITYPLEVPFLAVVGIAVFVLAVSRILLALPKFGGYVVFSAVPIAILVVGALIASREHISKNVLAGLGVLAALVVLAGGIVAAAAGPAELEEHGDETESHGEEGGLAPLRPDAPVVVRADG